MNRNRWALLGAVVAIVVGLLWWLGRPVEVDVKLTQAGAKVDAGVEVPTVGATRIAPLPEVKELVDGGAAPSERRGVEVIAKFGWGSGPNDLGRQEANESNPEAPMSVTIDALGNTWVLDQVNNRLVKIDKAGKTAGTIPLTLQAPQDVAIARDGTIAVMDRLVDKSVAVMSPDGKLQGEIPVEGKGIKEGGGVTGLFTDGDKVLVEREHGDTVTLGDTKGVKDAERPELPGRPARDGKTLLTAAISNGPAGKVLVTAIDRPANAHRFSTVTSFPRPVHFLVLLDTDLSSVIYVGAGLESVGSTDEKPLFELDIACLDPVDGRALGHVSLPANTSADETFRELTVSDEGGIVYLERTAQGSSLVRARCGQ